MMKLIVDKMPVTASECLFSAMGTGKHRCRHDGKLCPLLRGEECPHLMEGKRVTVGVDLAHSNGLTRVVPKPENLDGYNTQMSVIDDVTPEPKNRTTKRSTGKKAE